MNSTVHSNIQFLLDEGVATAYAGQVRDFGKAVGNDITGMFKSGDAKIAHVREVCAELIVWLKKEQKDNHDLQFEMNGFKNWAKTSRYFNIDYVYMLSDVFHSRLMADTKGWEHSKEHADSVGKTFSEFKKKMDASIDDAVGVFQSVKNIDDLVKVVNKFEQRANDYDKALRAAAKNPKVGKLMYMGGYQMMIASVGSLNMTVKKIVNLAE
jgi:hypothetical protein